MKTLHISDQASPCIEASSALTEKRERGRERRRNKARLHCSISTLSGVPTRQAMIMIRQQQPHHVGKGFHPRNSWRTQLQSSGQTMLCGLSGCQHPARYQLPYRCVPGHPSSTRSRARRVATCVVTASPNHRGDSVPLLIPWLLMSASSHTAVSMCTRLKRGIFHPGGAWDHCADTFPSAP